MAFVFNFAGSSDARVIGSLIICASVTVHGVPATPLTKLYGRSIQDQ